MRRCVNAVGCELAEMCIVYGKTVGGKTAATQMSGCGIYWRHSCTKIVARLHSSVERLCLRVVATHARLPVEHVDNACMILMATFATGIAVRAAPAALYMRNTSLKICHGHQNPEQHICAQPEPFYRDMRGHARPSVIGCDGIIAHQDGTHTYMFVSCH